LGGAAQIAKSDDRLAIGEAIEVKVLSWLRLVRQLARSGRFPKGGDEPAAILHAVHGAVAEILRRHDIVLVQGWE
jgi:hypothetical protein